MVWLRPSSIIPRFHSSFARNNLHQLAPCWAWLPESFPQCATTGVSVLLEGILLYRLTVVTSPGYRILMNVTMELGNIWLNCNNIVILGWTLAMLIPCAFCGLLYPSGISAEYTPKWWMDQIIWPQIQNDIQTFVAKM